MTILGIVIFIGLVGILYQVDRTIKDVQTTQHAIDDQSVAMHVQNCLEQALAHVGGKVGMQGGYWDAPVKRAQFGDSVIPIMWNVASGETMFPNKETVEESIATGIEKTIPGCVDLFYDGDFELRKGIPHVTVTMLDDTLTAELEYSLTLHQGRARKELSSWSGAVPSTLHATYAAANAYAQSPQKPYIKLKSLVDATKGMKIELTDLGNDVVAFAFIAGVWQWNYAVEYDWENIDDSFSAITALTADQINVLNGPVHADGDFLYGEVEGIVNVKKMVGNTPPTIPEYTPQTIIVGRTLMYPLKVTDVDGDHLEYKVLTPLPGLEITPQGYLRWGPTEYQDTTVRFRVSDGKGSSEGEITFIVESRPHNIRTGGWYNNY